MKDKVILINLPPTQNYKYENLGEVYPATGILLIGTILCQHGMKVKVIDGALHKNYQEIVLAAIDDDVAMVGFSVMTSQVSMAFGLSRAIKTAHYSVPIVWGGIHPILFPEQTVRDENIDIVVTGEGTRTANDLTDYLKGKRPLASVRGIAYKEPSGKILITDNSDPDDINNLPHFNFDILDNVEAYLGTRSVYNREIKASDSERLRIMPILTGLGCCYRCRFCINVFLKRKYRFRSAVSIIEEMERLQYLYKVDAFVFYDEDFMISRTRLLEFLQLIEQRGLKSRWRIWARVDYFRDNYINRELISRLDKNGLRSIVMGAESGSQKMLDLIEKQMKVDSILNSAKMLKDTAITPRYSFIVGLDGENRDDTRKTYKLCMDLIEANDRVDIAGPFIFRYYPGSPIFDEMARKYNIEIPLELKDWEGALSEEGYLKTENMSWLWPGFKKSIPILNLGISMLNGRLRHVNNSVLRAFKKIMMWRIRNLRTELPLELYIYSLLRYYRLTERIKV